MIIDVIKDSPRVLNYIDPGTAAMIIQIVIASAGGTIVIMRERIKLFFLNIWSKIRNGKSK